MNIRSPLWLKAIEQKPNQKKTRFVEAKTVADKAGLIFKQFYKQEKYNLERQEWQQKQKLE